jgi:hypothetical protein
MMSSTECIDRAIEAERRSTECTDLALREEFASLGRIWRHVARQAAWQDTFVLSQPQA